MTNQPSETLKNNYVNGISLTYGTSSRTHIIWTFIADGVNSNQICPCQVPGYVGDHYSCLNNQFSCTSSSSSCYSAFFRLLQQPVIQDIELRLCNCAETNIVSLKMTAYFSDLCVVKID